jgi:thiol-disulfide isomerase/thioredoxin
MKNLFTIIMVAGIICCGYAASAQDIPKWKVADLERFIKETDKPTILNFWATFCKPCIEELPYFQQLVKKYKSAGVELKLVSLDLSDAYPKKIAAFIAKQKITAPVVFLAETNADLFCPVVDEKWSGAIPASLFINNKTGYKKFFEEQLSEKGLEQEIKELIKK